MTEEFEALMNRRWIRKAENKELYYKVRDQLPEIRKFATEKMGCQIIENSLLVKMEKIPDHPEAFMGISDFTSMEEYAFLCVLLMFLEDREVGEQFILSQITEYFASNMPQDPPDWTVYTNRKRLICVLRYAQKQGMLTVTDGSESSFMDDYEGEVLYENTGSSRYFMRMFSADIMEYDSPEDFAGSGWLDVNEDRGIARRQRVYNRLLFSPGVYKEDGSEEDFEYFRYYGRRMSEELERMMDCRVHIHKGSAFLMEGENSRLGRRLPENNVMSDIVLLVCRQIQKKVDDGTFETDTGDMIYIDRVVWDGLLREVRNSCNSRLTKNYREMPDGKWIRTVTDAMVLWTIVKELPESRMVRISPAAGKISGSYPDEEKGEKKKA